MRRDLGDTSFSRVHDSRFKSALQIGIVSSVEVTENAANVRVILPDRVDHKGTPLITKPIPVLQSAATKKKSFAVPRIGTYVLVAKLPNSTSNYMVLGSFYNKTVPPPTTDPDLDYTEYDDGSIIQMDASNGTMTWDLKGGITLECQGDISVKSDAGTISLDSQGNMTLTSGGLITLNGANILLEGPVEINGNITHTGNITTSGMHTDANGVHQ